MDRAFKFLKNASPSWTGVAAGLDVAEGIGVSCADKIEIVEIERRKVYQRTIRLVMGTYHRVVRLQGKRVSRF